MRDWLSAFKKKLYGSAEVSLELMAAILFLKIQENDMDTILNTLLELDGQALLFIQNHLRFEELNPFMIRFTNLGEFGLIWIIITVLLLIPRRSRRAGICSALALIASLCVTNLFLKKLCGKSASLRSGGGADQSAGAGQRVVLPFGTCILQLRGGDGNL